jgi:hypothetical protein
MTNRINLLVKLCERFSTVVITYHDAYGEWCVQVDYGRCVADDCRLTRWTDDDTPDLEMLLTELTDLSTEIVMKKRC